MLAKESSRIDLPQELLDVLPSDPFEQLNVARKITSIALSTRVDALESEVSDLRDQLADRDNIIAGLESQLQSFDASLNETSEKLAVAEQDKENLMRENAQLSSNVRKLNRDVTKLEAFRKTLMRSLQEDEDNPASAPKVAASNLQANNEDDDGLQPSRTTSIQSQFSDAGNSNSGDTETEAVRPRIPHGPLLVSQTSTPRLTPPGSPPSLLASVSPSRTPKLLSPRRHSISFSTTRGLFDDRSSVFSSMPSSQYSSMSGLESGSQPGKTRVDGKEFFRQVRTRLTYEQFGSFLSNVKELNSHKQTKEVHDLIRANDLFSPTTCSLSEKACNPPLFTKKLQKILYLSLIRASWSFFFSSNMKILPHRLILTGFISLLTCDKETLRKVDEIFGPDNKDLYVIFEGLITRNVQ